MAQKVPAGPSRPTGLTIISVLFTLSGFYDALASVSNLQTLLSLQTLQSLPGAYYQWYQFANPTLVIISSFTLGLAILSIAVAIGFLTRKGWSYKVGLALPFVGLAISVSQAYLFYSEPSEVGPLPLSLLLLVPVVIALIWTAVIWVYLRRPCIKEFLGVGIPQ